MSKQQMQHDHDAQANQDAHDDHGADHSGHEQMFRRRFWVSLALSIPVLFYSPTLQDWLGYTAPAFPGSDWITPVFALIVSVVGGVTNVPRTILAGLGLGIVETFTSAFIGSYVSQVVLFAIVIVVLMASPRRATGSH